MLRASWYVWTVKDLLQDLIFARRLYASVPRIFLSQVIIFLSPSTTLFLLPSFLLLFFSTPVVIPFTAPFQPAHILGHLFCLLTCSIGTRLLPSSLVRANTLLRFWTLLPPPNLVRELIIDNGKHTDIAICDVSKLAGCLRVVCVHHWRGGRCGVRLPAG